LLFLLQLLASSGRLNTDDWFRAIVSNSELPEDVAQELQDIRFVVVAGPLQVAIQLAGLPNVGGTPRSWVPVHGFLAKAVQSG
jgi:hypothetical protein